MEFTMYVFKFSLPLTLLAFLNKLFDIGFDFVPEESV